MAFFFGFLLGAVVGAFGFMWLTVLMDQDMKSKGEEGVLTESFLAKVRDRD
jgi:hypothetical protein